MKCRRFWIKANGSIVCNSELVSGTVVGNVMHPPKKLSPTQRRRVDEWREVKALSLRIADYFDVWSYEPGTIDIEVSLIGPFGSEDVARKIRAGIIKISDQLNFSGIPTRIDRFPISRHTHEFYRQHAPPAPEGVIVGHEDFMWKLILELRAEDDIRGILGFVANEIEDRGLSEHIVFDEVR